VTHLRNKESLNVQVAVYVLACAITGWRGYHGRGTLAFAVCAVAAGIETAIMANAMSAAALTRGTFIVLLSAAFVRHHA
jgi:hypothetical protein